MAEGEAKARGATKVSQLPIGNRGPRVREGRGKSKRLCREVSRETSGHVKARGMHGYLEAKGFDGDAALSGET